MTQELLKVDDSQLIGSGICPSLNKLKCPLWIDGQNTIFEDGMVRKARGYGVGFLKQETNPIRGFLPNIRSGVHHLYFGTPAKLYTWNSASLVQDASTFQGIADETSTKKATQWSMESWGHWCAASNGVNKIQLNKNDGAGFSPISAGPDTAEIIKRHGPYLLAYATDQGGAYVEFSELDNLEVWPAANFLYLRELDSEVRAVAQLGSQHAVYSEDAMGMMSFIGEPFLFGFVPVLTGIGAVSKHAVISQGRRNFGFGRAGIWVTDATDYRYIDPPKLRLWLQKNVNWSQQSKIIGWWNPDRSLVLWALPTGGSTTNNMVIGYNYDTGAWTFWPLPVSAGYHRRVLAYPLMGFETGEVMFGENGVNANGAAMNCFVQTRPMDFGASDRWKYIDGFKLMIHELTGTLTAQIGTQNDLDDAIVWQTAQTIDDGHERMFERVSGKYISLKITSNQLGADFAFSGFTLYGEIEGAEA